jgi:hypothetical protein
MVNSDTLKTKRSYYLVHNIRKLLYSKRKGNGNNRHAKVHLFRIYCTVIFQECENKVVWSVFKHLCFLRSTLGPAVKIISSL